MTWLSYVTKILTLEIKHKKKTLNTCKKEYKIVK